MHGDDSAVTIAESQFSRPLQIVVDGDLQVLAGNGVLGAQVAHFATVAIDDHISGAVLPAPKLVGCLFDSSLADPIDTVTARIARVVEVVLADLADVADEVRGISITGIEPALLVDRLKLRQLGTDRKRV